MLISKGELVRYMGQNTLFIAFLLCLFSKMAFSQNNHRTTVFDTLYQLSVSKLEVQLNLDSLLLNKLTNKEWPCTLKVVLPDDQTFGLPVSVSVRSKSRRRYCDFPPLKFDFDKSELEDFGLDNEDEYKIVTHCLEATEGEEVLVKEFLTYQLFQIVTPLSLRAKLVDIIYIDNVSDRKVEKKAIFLESEKEFARAQKGELCDCMGTPKDSLDGLKYEIVAMFQYMIGNSDMDYLVERNIN
ncbi:MAG: hypothetical protein IPL46_20370 [Saprospiraceae bacterium]|nr:hypothetical protein [Saprospiraceae bacterium]